MFCSECKTVIKQIFKEFDLTPIEINIGEVILENELSNSEISTIQKQLKKCGFAIILDNRAKIIVAIKSLLIELLESETFDLKLKLSEYLSNKLGYEYHYLSNLFSELEETTIEKYFILLKVEKVKEYIKINKLSLSEISYKLGYSSPAHLTTQFKQVTGNTPTYYKSITNNKRN